jgi:hypothetical protein
LNIFENISCCCSLAPRHTVRVEWWVVAVKPRFALPGAPRFGLGAVLAAGAAEKVRPAGVHQFGPPVERYLVMLAAVVKNIIL